MPLPLAHGLVGATIVAAAHPEGSRWKPLLTGAAIAIAPDLDFALIWGLHLRGVHRAFTHSLAFALVAALLITAAVGWRRRAALAYGLALASHGLLDFAAAKNASGVMLLWPFSTGRFKLGVFGFAEMSPGMPFAELVYWTAWEAAIFLPIFVVVLLLRRRGIAMCDNPASQPSEPLRHG
jgi:membrane-bound metal-dependent hydrolase YbcI (DUF457 family)